MGKPKQHNHTKNGDVALKLHILSDLHLELDYMEPPTTQSDITILAGDIARGIGAIRWASKLSKPILYVLGNHEFYGFNLSSLTEKFMLQKKVVFLNNSYTTINDVSFFGSTLWTDFSFLNDPILAMYKAKQSINDYAVIKYNPEFKRLRPEDTLNLHKQSIRELQKFIELPGRKVVITHHAPSPMSVHPQYQKDPLTPSFASNLNNIIANSNIELWIHGHTHHSCDYKINNTRILSNPRGYAPHNTDFNPNLIIDI